MSAKIFWSGGVLFSLWIVIDIYKNRQLKGVAVYAVLWFVFALITRFLMTK